MLLVVFLRYSSRFGNHFSELADCMFDNSSLDQLRKKVRVGCLLIVGRGKKTPDFRLLSYSSTFSLLAI